MVKSPDVEYRDLFDSPDGQSAIEQEHRGWNFEIAFPAGDLHFKNDVLPRAKKKGAEMTEIARKKHLEKLQFVDESNQIPPGESDRLGQTHRIMNQGYDPSKRNKVFDKDKYYEDKKAGKKRPHKIGKKELAVRAEEQIRDDSFSLSDQIEDDCY